MSNKKTFRLSDNFSKKVFFQMAFLLVDKESQQYSSYFLSLIKGRHRNNGFYQFLETNRNFKSVVEKKVIETIRIAFTSIPTYLQQVPKYRSPKLPSPGMILRESKSNRSSTIDVIIFTFGNTQLMAEEGKEIRILLGTLLGF